MSDLNILVNDKKNYTLYTLLVVNLCIIKYTGHYRKEGKRHLTNGNCCGRHSRPRVPENSSRATPFVLFSSTTFCRLLELFHNSFIATAKTSVTCNVMRHFGFINIHRLTSHIYRYVEINPLNCCIYGFRRKSIRFYS